MADAAYNQVISEIKALNLSDQLRLLEEMATLIRKKTIKTEPRSILELIGFFIPIISTVWYDRSLRLDRIDVPILIIQIYTPKEGNPLWEVSI